MNNGHILNAIVLWSPNLRGRVCEAVDEFTAMFRIQVDDLRQMMYKSGGIGLAAPQCGLFKRFTVLNIGDNVERPVENHVFVNPVIEDSIGLAKQGMEGCLSLPGVKVPVKRQQHITVSWQDVNGDSHRDEFHGMDAVVIQHEVDHLDGIYCIDRVSRLVREIAMGKFMKEKRHLVPAK